MRYEKRKISLKMLLASLLFEVCALLTTIALGAQLTQSSIQRHLFVRIERGGLEAVNRIKLG